MGRDRLKRLGTDALSMNGKNYTHWTERRYKYILALNPSTPYDLYSGQAQRLNPHLALGEQLCSGQKRFAGKTATPLHRQQRIVVAQMEENSQQRVHCHPTPVLTIPAVHIHNCTRTLQLMANAFKRCRESTPVGNIPETPV